MCHYTHLTPFFLLRTIYGSAGPMKTPMAFYGSSSRKGKDITNTPEDYIQRKYHELNLRPRKCLGYKTPYEVYFSKVLHLA